MNNDFRPDSGNSAGNNENQQYTYSPNGSQNNEGTPNGGYQNYGYQNGYGYQQYPQNQYGYQGYVDESGLFSENRLRRLNGASARLTVGDWMKADCFAFLNLIPILGQIALIVIYCILAFSSKTAQSLKTRYQASLIWAGILLALYIVIIVIIVALGISLAGLATDLGTVASARAL